MATLWRDVSTRVVRDTVIVTAGQSIASLLHDRAGTKVLLDAVVGLTAANSAELLGMSSGGSTSTNQNVDSGTNYWFDGVADDNGTNLTTFIAEIAGLTNKPDQLIIDLSYGDTLAANGGIGGLTPAQAVLNYTNAMNEIFSRMRAACNAGNPDSVEIFLMIMGSRESGQHPLGMGLIREAQLQLITNGTNVHHGCELYDLETYDGVHPTPAAFDLIGERLASAIANQAGILGQLLGPKITAINKISDTEIDVVITAQTGDALAKPAVIENIAIEEAPGMIVPISTTSCRHWWRKSKFSRSRT